MADVLTPLDEGPIHLVAPFHGKTDAVSAVLTRACSLNFPEPGHAREHDGVRIEWFGLGQALLIGCAPPAGLDDLALVSGQSDGWLRFALDVPDPEAVLARLVPIEVAAMKRGDVARSELHHVMVSVARTGEGWVIGCLRSFAGTVIHAVEDAARGVAARRAVAN